MKIDKHTGLLDNATYIPSPNADNRPENSEPELIVVHNISLPPGEFGEDWVQALFTNKLPADAHPYFAEIHNLRVSSHLYIRRNGDMIQFVPFHHRAWHAGVSRYQDRECCNDFSIGIELEGTDDIAYEDIQYQRLADVITLLCETYAGLNPQAIVGHCDIAPERKTDPGVAFDWHQLHARLKHVGNTHA